MRGRSLRLAAPWRQNRGKYHSRYKVKVDVKSTRNSRVAHVGPVPALESWSPPPPGGLSEALPRGLTVVFGPLL